MKRIIVFGRLRPVSILIFSSMLFLSCGGGGGSSGGSGSGSGSGSSVTPPVVKNPFRACPSPSKPPCVLTVAGSSTGAEGAANGKGLQAEFKSPHGIALSPDGKKLYVAEPDPNRIRVLTFDASGDATVDLFAGGGTIKAGPLPTVLIRQPKGLATDAAGNLYVGLKYYGEEFLSRNIRKIADGKLAYLTGTGTGMTGPWLLNLTTDASGKVFYALISNINDSNRNEVVEINMSTDSAVRTTMTGNMGFKGTDGGVVIGPDGKVYATITEKPYIFRADSKDTPFKTIAGSGTAETVDHTSDAKKAGFNRPVGMVFDKAGNLYVAELSHSIRKLTFDAGGKVTAVGTLGGKTGSAGAQDGTADSATFNQPYELAYDKTNDLLYVSEVVGNRIRRIVLP